MKTEKAIFAAGCFWGIEAAFAKIPGIIKTTVGYTGGSMENPSYKDVCTDQTGHAEAVEVIFNPEKISYDKLLTVFWQIHDPTSLNAQGPDIGTQYRSAIFYLNTKQKAAALRSKEEVQKQYKKKIVTQIEKASNFYKAEEYHQKYTEKNPGACHIPSFHLNNAY